MSAGKAIHGRLSTVSAVTAICATRTYPHGDVPDPVTLPFVAYDVQDTDTHPHYTGEGPFEVFVDLSCVAASKLGAAALAKAVRQALNVQSGTWGGIVVLGTFVSGGGDEAEKVTDARGVVRYVSELSVRLWYTPPA